MESKIGDLTVRQLSDILRQGPSSLTKAIEKVPHIEKIGKELKDSKDSKEQKDHKEHKDQKDHKDQKEGIKDGHKEVMKEKDVPDGSSKSPGEGPQGGPVIQPGIDALVQRVSGLEQEVAQLRQGAPRSGG
jgi:hypothetical protein